MIQAQPGVNKAKVDLLIFVPGLVIILATALIMSWKPDLGQAGVTRALNGVYRYFTSTFMLTGVACFGLLLWLAFGRYGNVKLGLADDKPEFSYLTWIFMLFSSGVGIGLMIWSIVEPIYYIEGPPLGLEPFSPQAYEWAHMVPMFHWGFSAWAIYCLPTIPAAYMLFVRRETALRVSSTCRPILKSQTDGPLGRFIELVILLGTLGATGTSLGLAVPLVAAIISRFTGLADTMSLKAAVMSLWFLICAVSLYTGLSKGMKLASQIKVWFGLGLLLYVLMFGPTSYILDSWVNSLGLLLDNFFRLKFYTEPLRIVAGQTGAFPQFWTVFYWAWWIAYTPMVALFVARISRGRTIRQLVIAECFWGTLGCWVFLAILGAFSLYLQNAAILDVSEIHKTYSDAVACVEVISQLPLKGIILPLYALLCFIFLATLLNASAYTLASICTSNLKGDAEPSRWLRLLWAAVISVFAMGILITGGDKALKTIQTSTIVGALPLIPIMVLMVVAFFKAINQDFKDKLQQRPLVIDSE